MKENNIYSTLRPPEKNKKSNHVPKYMGEKRKNNFRTQVKFEKTVTNYNFQI